MSTLIRAELDKLRTLRSTWVVLGLGILLNVAITTLVLATSKHLHGAPSEIAEVAFAFSGVTVAILCASAFASEYQDRTIATTFTLVPARGRVVLAKAATGVMVGLLVALLTTVASYTIAAEWLHLSAVSWPWTVAETTQAVAGNLVLGASLALVGVGIGGIAQNPPVAGSTIGLVWFGLSSLLAAFLPFFKHYGIPAAQTALTQPTGHHYYGFAGALATTLALGVLLLLAGIRRVQRTDV
jgi:ABC-2 type transport system permease protein